MFHKGTMSPESKLRRVGVLTLFTNMYFMFSSVVCNAWLTRLTHILNTKDLKL